VDCCCASTHGHSDTANSSRRHTGFQTTVAIHEPARNSVNRESLFINETFIHLPTLVYIAFARKILKIIIFLEYTCTNVFYLFHYTTLNKFPTEGRVQTWNACTNVLVIRKGSVNTIICEHKNRLAANKFGA
jgi:hypothetical protein